MSSYAEIASKGPKQSPEQAAAPQPPQVDASESASTSSLVDVDTPSVHTVPSDFADQDVQTDTQASRVGREEAARERREEASAEASARAEAHLAKKKAASRARRADGWITRHLAGLSDGAGAALVAGNLIAVVALGGWLGHRAWGLHERGSLGWKNVGVGLGVLGVVGAFEGLFAKYVFPYFSFTFPSKTTFGGRPVLTDVPLQLHPEGEEQEAIGGGYESGLTNYGEPCGLGMEREWRWRHWEREAFAGLTFPHLLIS
ncbi:hypothetical protein QBC33DRAFT_494313 [Phialemonium atrogriseum]|uniref:Mitochondrial outer membrane protein OM14 C-terminal domain-containing protein n=1 Tax=Phialemonium atrogriseum TaxID=1093897 RepID=A0AAJ0FJY5_9PEZI|nr:uncharacterized protein QBC33DRAFT_494313 [Phialemonium atrogriseum]KAK1765838.1 hypothetical protein QBC33DRAFT_494313 [Phialemonium atrogriseum]